MLLGRRRDTEALDGLNRDSRVQIPRTMMAAVAYATEFGGRHDPAVFGGQSPAYVAKWLYSLASNRNDSALKFITNSPYIKVPSGSAIGGISEAFKSRLKSFAGIIISEAPEGSRTYEVTYDTEPIEVQFMTAFFVMMYVRVTSPLGGAGPILGAAATVTPRAYIHATSIASVSPATVVEDASETLAVTLGGYDTVAAGTTPSRRASPCRCTTTRRAGVRRRRWSALRRS